MGFILRTLVIVLCCLVTTSGARAGDPCGEGHLRSEAATDDGMLVLHWTGTIREDMAQRIAGEFDQAKDRVKAVVLSLSSCGGSAATMHRTIGVLKRIRQTHRLTTVVWRGGFCASACVNIFLQGSRRVAALTSSWLFHEPGLHGYSTVAPITSPEATEQMLKEFEAVDGISKRWLRRLRANIKRADWWQTGNDLWEAKSGIITNVVGNSVPRDTEEQKSLGAGDLSPCLLQRCGHLLRGEAAPTISS